MVVEGVCGSVDEPTATAISGNERRVIEGMKSVET